MISECRENKQTNMKKVMEVKSQSRYHYIISRYDIMISEMGIATYGIEISPERHPLGGAVVVGGWGQGGGVCTRQATAAVDRRAAPRQVAN